MPQKQTSVMLPIYKGTDPLVLEWAKNLILVLNQELLKTTGRINELETQALDYEARLTGHGI